jgi:hypothetical protein
VGGFVWLGALTALQHLRLAQSGAVDDTLWPHLAAATGLVTLELQCCRHLTGEVLSPTGDVATPLNCSSSSSSHDTQQQQQQQQQQQPGVSPSRFQMPPLPRLTQLDLGGCSGLTDSGLVALLGACPALAALNLEVCGQLSDGGVATGLASCSALQRLKLSGNKQLTAR